MGQRVGTSDRIARLIEAGRMEVRFRLTQRDFGGLLPGTNQVSKTLKNSSELLDKKIQVKWRIGDRYLNFMAIIERLGAEIDATSGGIDAYARLLNIDLDTPLRPGAFVEVLVPAKMYQEVLRIPDTAIGGENEIYLVEGGRLVSRSIEVVRKVDKWVLIRGANLDGKEIITRPFPEMADGIRVAPR